jgi:hypothetical protein
MNPDYKKVCKLKLDTLDKRWKNGKEHHPMSQRIMDFLEEYDFNQNGDRFCWKIGGDGDNGEDLMYELDAFFEMLDRSKNA